MRNKLIYSLLASAMLLSGSLTAQDDHRFHNDPTRVLRYKNFAKANSNSQNHKLSQQATWSNFKRNNPQWLADFDVQSGMPTRAFGPAMPLAVVNGNYETAAREFLNTHLAAFGADANAFVLKSIRQGKKQTYLTMHQQYEGIEVLFSEYTLRITPDNKVPLWGLRFYPTPNLSTTPALSPAQFDAAATADLEGVQTITDNGLKILPVAKKEGGYELRLIKELSVRGQVQGQIPFNYTTWVDAQTGVLWYRENKVCSAHPEGHDTPNVSVPVKADIRFNPLQAKQNKGLPYLKATINGTNYVADANGNFNLNITAATTATIKLDGTKARVYNGASGTTIPTATGVTIPADGSPIDLTASFTETQLAAYYHPSVMHDHFVAITGSNVLGTFPMQVRVDRTDGTCNAFYDGGINFYAPGGGCPATVLFDDVVYHEFGHHLNSVYTNGSVQDGGIGEGYADVWAMTRTDNPLLGAGFQTSADSYVRRYDQAPKVFPNDVVGEVHADGEIIAGAWWDTRLNLNSLTQMTALFTESNLGYSEGSTYGETLRGILIETLNADDNDGNIANGTPNAQAITTAFARHGISLITGYLFEHVGTVGTPAINTPITVETFYDITGEIALNNFAGIKLYYTTNNNNSWTSLTMTAQGNSIYRAAIPAQPEGTIVRYYVTTEDIFGAAADMLPLKMNTANPMQSNLPYTILIGYNTIITENFDANTLPGWTVNPDGTDNATTGTWVNAAPIGTTIDAGTIINPSADHSATGTKCFMTGNGGGAGGADDVDGGVTSLLSPTINMSNINNPAVSYWRWYTNAAGANPGNDPIRVLISNDNGNSWVTVEHTYASSPDDGAQATWRRNAFRVADYVTPTANMRLKFYASDSLIAGANLEGGSLVEAAIDDILVHGTLTTATQNIADNTAISIYPNPANSSVTVQMNKYGDKQNTITVFNTLGQVVATQTTKGTSTTPINTNHLAAGTYLIEVKGEGFVARQKLQIID